MSRPAPALGRRIAQPIGAILAAGVLASSVLLLVPAAGSRVWLPLAAGSVSAAAAVFVFVFCARGGESVRAAIGEAETLGEERGRGTARAECRLVETSRDRRAGEASERLVAIAGELESHVRRFRVI